MADNKINFNDLTDFSRTNQIVPGKKIYAVVLRKSGPLTKSAFKFQLDALGTYFLATEDVNNVRKKIKNFRESLETLTENFETIEYLKNHNYETKYDANKKRKELATEEILKSVLEDYLTEYELKSDVQEALRYGTECANSFAASMASAASTARGAEASNNTRVETNDQLTEAIENINTEED